MGQGKGDQHDLIEMYTELTDWRAVAIVLAIVILLLLVTWLPPFGLIS